MGRRSSGAGESLARRSTAARSRRRCRRRRRPRSSAGSSRSAREAIERWPGVSTVGIGVPGLYDPAAGTARFLVNFPGGWHGKPVAAPVSEALGLPVALINDARAFGLAELRLGAGRGARSMVGLTLGTGRRRRDRGRRAGPPGPRRHGRRARPPDDRARRAVVRLRQPRLPRGVRPRATRSRRRAGRRRPRRRSSRAQAGDAAGARRAGRGRARTSGSGSPT